MSLRMNIESRLDENRGTKEDPPLPFDSIEASDELEESEVNQPLEEPRLPIYP